MVELSSTLLQALGFSALANAALIPRQETRPIYAIAHRVIRTSAVTAALDHGANAIEIDLAPEKNGWYADHDGKGTTAGGTAREVLEFMAKQRDNGKPLTFVWLDVKDPDTCKKDEPCSIEALRDIVHDTLGKSGVRALWGFYTTSEHPLVRGDPGRPKQERRDDFLGRAPGICWRRTTRPPECPHQAEGR